MNNLQLILLKSGDTVNKFFAVSILYILVLLTFCLNSHAQVIPCSSCKIRVETVNKNEQSENCPICGDRIINRAGEQCDLSNFGSAVKPINMPQSVWDSKSCIAAGQANECKFLFPPYCGDGILNGDEECDGNSFAQVLARPEGISDIAWLLKVCNPPESSNPCQFNWNCKYHALNYINHYDVVHQRNDPSHLGEQVFSGINNAPCLQTIFGADFDTATQRACNGDYNTNRDCMLDDSMLMKLFAKIRINEEIMNNNAPVPGIGGDISAEEKQRLLNLILTKTVDDLVTLPDGRIVSWWDWSNTEMIRAWSLVTDRDSWWTSIHNRATVVLTPLSTPNPLNTPAPQPTPRSDIGWVFDESCNLVTEIESADQICGTTLISVSGSPISLIFSESEVKKQNSYSLVQFDLNPYRKGTWVVWKASAANPLLVYKSSEEQVISDGSQLFGNWTFGGKDPSVLPITLDKEKKLKSWENGYQPLAKLDQNNDSFLSGDELKNIYLWFDRNRNAKSEEGELVHANEQGISRIFTKYDRIDPKSGDVHAKLGFERIIDGRIEQGRSVDWFTQIYSSPEEAYLEIASQNVNSQSSDYRTASGKQATELESLVNTDAESVFSGGWIWGLSTSDSSTIKPAGLLWFNDNAKNLSGFSLSELAIDSERSDGVKSILAKFMIKGRIDSYGKMQFEVSGDNSPPTFNEAYIDENGFLVGQSTFKFSDDSDSDSEKNISFAWKARRIGSMFRKLS